jgi:molybdopterin-binding protein
MPYFLTPTGRDFSSIDSKTLALSVLGYRWCMDLSARNQLQGRITKITLGDIMAHVVVKVENNTIESVITRQSAKEMKLKRGDKVEVVIKSTEVMLKK